MTVRAEPLMDGRGWLRRAQPLLGTLVDIGVPEGADSAMQAAFTAMRQVHHRMSAFEPDSDLSRIHAAEVGVPVWVHDWTAQVLRLAQDLFDQTEGQFDVALGSGAWRLQQEGQDASVVRLSAATRLDLGGLAKGWAVDQALEAALSHGAVAAWVNAGGDLRVQGLTLPIVLRDEVHGGVRPWAELADGALATSDFRAGARSRLHGASRVRHLSVLAPRCAWADALTKVLAQRGSPDEARSQKLLQHYQAQLWVHASSMNAP